MFYKGRKYIYIGFVSGVHGKKGKVILRIRRYIPPEKLPPRVFIKRDKELEEFRVKLIKPYKNGFILKLSKLKNEEDAEKIVSSDVYISESDLPRKTKIEIGIIPPFIQEVKLKEEEIAELKELGFITRPRGLQGAVAVLIPKEKEEIVKKTGMEVFIKLGEKFFKTEIRSAKKIKETGDGNIYISLKLLHVNDVNSAERLRKGKIYFMKEKVEDKKGEDEKEGGEVEKLGRKKEL